MIKNIINKLILSILLVSFLIIPSYTTKAFLDSGLGANLYLNIDEGIEEMENKVFQKEINKEGSIDETLNNYIETLGGIRCIKDVEINGKNDYISIGDTHNFIDFDCLGKKELESITIDDLVKYRDLINSFININRIKTITKTKKVYEIAHLGLFADGSIKNSPFDLIVDLQEIDQIIFNDKINYDSEDIDFLSSFKDNPSTIVKVNDGKIPETENLDQSNNNGDNTSDNNTSGNENNPSQNLDGNNFNCPNDNSQSGLSPEEQEKLINDINKNDYVRKVLDNGVITTMPNSNKLDVPDFGDNSFNGNYIGINDNLFWPCNDFFCIELGFDTYNIRALDYSSSISIENVINTSNSHLKKAVNVSLQQGKMATNNFEIGLRDLDLPGQFHLAFIIKSKPPPILSLENIIKKDEKEGEESPLIETNDKNSAGNLLTEYYKNLGLDYKRANDIKIFRKVDSEVKKVINNTELNQAFIVKRYELEEKFNKQIRDKIKYIEKTNDTQLNNEILEGFYKESVELDGFIISIIEYTKELNTLIIALREIPIY